MVFPKQQISKPCSHIRHLGVSSTPKMRASKILNSKVGQRILSLPPTVQLQQTSTHLTITGPRGSLNMFLEPYLTLQTVEVDGSDKKRLKIDVENREVKAQRCMWGTTNSLIDNMITGVTEGFTCTLRMVGVGYRAQLMGSTLDLKCGYSHPIQLQIPKGITVVISNPQRIKLVGNNLQNVKQFAASIRRWRPPEPYNQKGIFVDDETIRKKEGKKK
jgi:large subunit ribosomal protein L6